MNAIRISKLIPHGEGMCLIDEVVDYDEHAIHCRTRSHRRPDNPLAADGRLSGLAIIEYAAQAAAIHAGLTGAGIGRDRAAYVGQVKAVRLFAQSLSGVDGVLELMSECVLSQNSGAVYRFKAQAGEPVAQGQINLITPS